MVGLVLCCLWAKTRRMSSPVYISIFVEGYSPSVPYGSPESMADAAVAKILAEERVNVDPIKVLAAIRKQRNYIRKKLEAHGQWFEAFKLSGFSIEQYLFYLLGANYWSGVLALIGECNQELRESILGYVPTIEYELDDDLRLQAEDMVKLLKILKASLREEHLTELLLFWEQIEKEYKQARKIKT